MSPADLVVVALLAYLAGYGVGRWDSDRRWLRRLQAARAARAEVDDE